MGVVTHKWVKKLLKPDKEETYKPSPKKPRASREYEIKNRVERTYASQRENLDSNKRTMIRNAYEKYVKEKGMQANLPTFWRIVNQLGKMGLNDTNIKALCRETGTGFVDRYMRQVVNYDR